MGRLRWLFAVGLPIAYVGIVALIGFSGTVALTINFLRVALGLAILIVYFPSFWQALSAPKLTPRDYLLIGIFLTWTSNEMFATGNEYGRIFGVDMSIFTNVVAGFFSLLLVIGGAFHVLAPNMGDKVRVGIAAAVGAVWGALVVFVAPLFR